MTDIIAHINKKIEACKRAARQHPEAVEMYQHTATVLAALVGDIEQGLHEGDET